MSEYASHHDERQYRQDVETWISKKRPPRQNHRLWRQKQTLNCLLGLKPKEIKFKNMEK